MKIRFDIEYDGTRFHGWQKQDGIITVQETLENAVSRVFGGLDVIVYGAGRTDANVHAINQVAHIETLDSKTINRWKSNIHTLGRAVNSYLHDTGLVVKKTSFVSDDFHARFSATQREYLYLVHNRSSSSTLLKNRCWHVSRKLDVDKMNRAARLFVGTHNLSAFRGTHCQANSPIKTINSISVKKRNDFIIINVKAKSFLYNQVRIMVGTLKQVGLSKFPPEYISILLENGDRSQSGPTAPPFGLYLKNVEYLRLHTV
jgi:tRNA pseudouridine38-40 synthase